MKYFLILILAISIYASDQQKYLGSEFPNGTIIHLHTPLKHYDKDCVEPFFVRDSSGTCWSIWVCGGRGCGSRGYKMAIKQYLFKMK